MENVRKAVNENNNLAMEFVDNVRMWLEADRQNHVYLYGAGDNLKWVISFMQKYGIPIELILDSREKNFKVIEDIPVVSFSSFREKHSSSEVGGCWFVISAPSAAEPITEIIRKYYPESPITGCDMQMYTRFIPDYEQYRGYINEHLDEIGVFCQSLADDLSRRTLESVLLGRITGDYRYYNDCYTSNAYYEEDIISFNENEVLVELGAYDGKTLEQFIDLCPNYNAAYCFEPEVIHLPRLYAIRDCQNQSGKRIVIIEKGAWEESGTLRFVAGKESEDVGSFISDDNDSDYTEVEVTTVDEAVQDQMTFMKVDIEGAELQALKGAKNQIQHNKPKLAVSVYHKPEDILEIWKYLKCLVPEYRFYLRHHTRYSGTDTILYAVL